MRILFLHHFPLTADAVGRLVERWALALVAAGHEVRALVVDDGTQGDEPFVVDRITCGQRGARPSEMADELDFELPRFADAAPVATGGRFVDLSDEQLARYRHRLRRQLDQQIDHFNPHIIHAQHVWVQGQLALESGVPYVLGAWGPELADYHADPRYRPIANQAAENASRILAPDERLRQRVIETFDIVAERAVLMADELAKATEVDQPFSQTSASLVGIFQAVLDERFGPVR